MAEQVVLLIVAEARSTCESSQILGQSAQPVELGINALVLQLHCLESGRRSIYLSFRATLDKEDVDVQVWGVREHDFKQGNRWQSPIEPLEPLSASAA